MVFNRVGASFPVYGGQNKYSAIRILRFYLFSGKLKKNTALKRLCFSLIF
jgi:hypothetical protein